MSTLYEVRTTIEFGLSIDMTFDERPSTEVMESIIKDCIKLDTSGTNARVEFAEIDFVSHEVSVDDVMEVDDE